MYLSEELAKEYEKKRRRGFWGWVGWMIGFDWSIVRQVEPQPEIDYPGYTVWLNYHTGERRITHP